MGSKRKILAARARDEVKQSDVAAKALPLKKFLRDESWALVFAISRFAQEALGLQENKGVYPIDLHINLKQRILGMVKEWSIASDSCLKASAFT